MRRILAIAMMLAVAIFPSAARAYNIHVTVANETPNCAWITIYTAGSFGALSPWGIVGTPGFVGPGQTRTFEVHEGYEVKVRAEIKPGKECGNTPNIADTYDRQKPGAGRTLSARIVRHANGQFNLWLK